jgi:hypothetical protein
MAQNAGRVRLKLSVSRPTGSPSALRPLVKGDDLCKNLYSVADPVDGCHPSNQENK